MKIKNEISGWTVLFAVLFVAVAVLLVFQLSKISDLKEDAKSQKVSIETLEKAVSNLEKEKAETIKARDNEITDIKGDLAATQVERDWAQQQYEDAKSMFENECCCKGPFERMEIYRGQARQLKEELTACQKQLTH